MATQKNTGKNPKTSHHYMEEAIEAAVKAVQEGTAKSEAARLYNVPRSTLVDRLSGRPPRSKVRKTVLSQEEEDRLADWIKKSAKNGFGRTKSQVLSSVQAVVKGDGRTTPFKNGMPGRKWFQLFLKRHSEITRPPGGLGALRAGVTEEKIKQWFVYVHQDITHIDGDVLNNPQRIFNCDESGFLLGGKITKVLDTPKQITVMACGSASGDVHPPLLIFPGQRFTYDPMDGFPEAHFARTSDGCIDSSLFLRWIESAFIPQTKDLEKPLVLFVDALKTHVTLEVCQVCKDKGVIIYQLPSDSSHIVQPLDLTTFKTLKQAWQEEVHKYQTQSGAVLGKKDFAKVFRKAWERGITAHVVASGFRAAGIYPWKPENVNLSKAGPSRLRANDDSPHHDPNAIVEKAHDLGQSNPPSPSPLPPLSPSPAPFPTENISSPLPPSSPLPCSSSMLTSSTLPTSSSLTTSHPRPPIPSSPSSTSSYSEDFQKLLFLVANNNHQTLAHRIAVHDTGTSSHAPEEVLFNRLYGRLNELVRLSDIRPRTPSLHSLESPSRWKKSKPSHSHVTPQPSDMLTREQFRKFKSTGKKSEEEEDVELKKKAREEKKKAKEEKKKRKREQQNWDEKKKRKVEEEKKKPEENGMAR